VSFRVETQRSQQSGPGAPTLPGLADVIKISRSSRRIAVRVSRKRTAKLRDQDAWTERPVLFHLAHIDVPITDIPWSVETCEVEKSGVFFFVD